MESKGKVQETSTITGVFNESPILRPSLGSIAGGTRLTVQGHGFTTTDDETTVTIGGSPCEIISASHSELVCITPAQAEADYDIHVTVRFVYS